MRIEKLEFNKIKVTVFPVDLINMNINLKSLTPDSPELHIFLSGIMEKIREETGFNPYSEKTVVEASPMGDCMVLTVTKLSDKKTEICNNRNKKVRAVLKNKKPNKNIYFFDDFDDMTSAVSLLSEETLIASSLYKIENRFALSVRALDLSEFGMLSEFSSECDKNSMAVDFLNEHGEIIAKGEKLFQMAEGIKSL